MLFAQSAPAVEPNWGFAAFAVLGGVGFVAFAALVVILSFRYARRSREMLHEERMMAVKHGQPLEESGSAQSKFMHNAFWISFWLVALVPSAAFSAAASASEGERPLYFVLAVWIGAAAASIAAVVCATVLMLASRRRSAIGEGAWAKRTPEMGTLEKEMHV